LTPTGPGRPARQQRPGTGRSRWASPVPRSLGRPLASPSWAGQRPSATTSSCSGGQRPATLTRPVGTLRTDPNRGRHS